jgi:putative transposase
MKRSRFGDEQIIGILKEHQAGLPAVDLCRKYGVSDATFYKWRSKYGGMEVAEAKRLKALEDENGKLKRLLADAMLDVSTLKEMLGKTAEARLKEERRDLGNNGKGLLTAPGLRPDRYRSARVPLSVDARR